MTSTQDERRKSLGTFGETYTCHELKRRGYEIVDRNVRFRSGEIDIVAREGGELVFVEVKTRRPSAFATPEDALSVTRMAHLEAAIDAYFQGAGREGPYRIEVAALEVGEGGRVIRFDLLRDPGVR